MAMLPDHYKLFYQSHVTVATCKLKGQHKRSCSQNLIVYNLSLTQNSTVESGADRLSLHGVQLLAHGAVPGVWVSQQTECILNTHKQTNALASGHKGCKCTATHRANQVSTSTVYLHQQQTRGRGVEQISLYAQNIIACLNRPLHQYLI